MLDISDHAAVVITAWSTVGAATAAFIAVFVGLAQGRKALQEAHRASDVTIQQAKVAAAYQLINQLDERWNSAAMRARRQEVAKLLLPLQPVPDGDALDEILDLFETFALCVRDEVVPLKLAAHFLGYWAIHYWFAATARINYVRATDPVTWEDLAACMPALLEYRAERRQRSVAEITPTTDQLRRFLQEEING